MTTQSQNSRSVGWDRAILLALAAAWVFAMACVAAGDNHNSDGATAPLQAEDILHGNLFLSGWSVSIDQYYTLDTAVSTVVTACLGLNPVGFVVQSLGAIILVGLTGFVLARQSDTAGWITAALLIVLVGLPTPFQTLNLFGIIAHILTLACALLGLLGLSWHYAPESSERRKYFLPIYGSALFLAAAGDPLIWYIAGLPFLAAGVVVAWRERNWRPWRQVLAATLAAGVAAKALIYFLQYKGYHIIQLRPSFLAYVVSWSKLPGNFYLDGRSLLLLFGLPVAGPSRMEELLAVVRLLAGVAAVLATLVVVGRRSKPPARIYIDYALLAGILFNHASFIMTNLPFGDGTAHYLLPSVVYMVILAARRAGPFIAERLTPARSWVHPLVLATLAVLVALAAPVLWAQGHTPVNEADHELANWLQRRGLRQGYAEFWQANIITMLTGERVQVRQTMLSPIGQIAPYHWLSKADWYKEPANFYICLPEISPNRAALATFGPPSEIHQVGQYRVMIWDHDIQPLLHDFSGVINPAILPLDGIAMGQMLAPGVIIDKSGHWIDEQPRPQPTVIMYGPYIKLPAGRYRVQFKFAATAVAPTDTMICEATIQKGDVVLNRKSFSGTDLSAAKLSETVTLVIDSPGPNEPVEFRIWRSGQGKLTVLSLILDKD